MKGGDGVYSIAWKQRVIIWLVPQLIRVIYFFLSRSICWQFVGNVYHAGQPERFLLAFWHARLLMMPYAFRQWQGYMLISDHRDGGFIADTMRLIGIRTIRGSTTRGGARAMLQMLRKVKQEACDLGITPDGPKGPREVVQQGTVQMAIKSGLPILPVCYASDRCWRANSWDHFYIPKPFSRGVMVYGEYVYLTAEEPFESALARVQQAMDETQARADAFFISEHLNTKG
ncbi:MAG: lysophospholipid acyltransferase family protein [Zetaproteobacteria bacterium]|nr:lysophospholipid acyltransferase family protein [Zetaproteobacteria bacterium]